MLPSRRSNRNLPWPLAVLLVLALVFACLKTNPSLADSPNVVLIYTDDQGYGDVSCLNPDSKIETRNFDRLAREGMTFSDAHCSDTVCTPSRYGLLTGRYSWRTELKRGVFGAERPCLIEDGRMTLASLLRDQGYATAMVGKWHLGMDFPGQRGDRDWSKPVLDMPLDKGFDYFWGIPASMNYGVLAWFDGRFAAVPPVQYTQKKPNAIAISDYRIMPPYEILPGKLGDTDRWGNVKGQIEVAPDFVDSECLTRFTDQSLAWIKSKANDARNGRPFFLYLPLTSPHKPVIPIEPFRGKSGAGAYGDFLLETDWHIGRILDLLDQLELADETLVIVSSDNGPENTWPERLKRYSHRSNGVYREGKRSIYEGGHRVPFFVRWPKQVKPGAIYKGPICQTDVLATLADILGVSLPANAGEDSISFYSALLDPNSPNSRPPIIHHSAQGGFAIRDGRWKLIMNHRKQSQELYDVESDPSETNDLLADQPAVVSQLTDRITEIVRRGRSGDGPVQANDQPWWEDLTWLAP